MKELENNKPDKPEIKAEQQIKKEKLIHRFKIHPGHRVWQIDLTTKIITEATDYEEYVEVKKNGRSVKRKKLVVKENHLYCSALNADNADKHFIKMIYGITPKQLLNEANRRRQQGV